MANKTKRAEREGARLARQATFRRALSGSKRATRASQNQDIASRFFRDLRFLYGNKFVRTFDSWRATRSKRPERIKSSLAAHLLQVYPVPIFFGRAFVSDDIDGLYRDWYVVVAQGESLYRSTDIRYILTKKEIHTLVTEAPQNNTLHQNLWWSKAYVLSGYSRAFADLVARSNLVRMGCNNAVRHKSYMAAWDGMSFWKEVLLFFSPNRVSLNDFNDYLDFFQANDIRSMRGRTLRNLALLRDEWHMSLAENQGSDVRWEGVDVPDKSYTYKRSDGITRYEVRQLKNGRDLAKEGRIMHHCVYSYLSRCSEGLTSIWTVIKKEPGNELGKGAHVATIELSRDYSIREVRGKWNRIPEQEAKKVVRQWASGNNLHIEDDRVW